MCKVIISEVWRFWVAYNRIFIFTCQFQKWFGFELDFRFDLMILEVNIVMPCFEEFRLMSYFINGRNKYFSVVNSAFGLYVHLRYVYGIRYTFPYEEWLLCYDWGLSFQVFESFDVERRFFPSPFWGVHGKGTIKATGLIDALLRLPQERTARNQVRVIQLLQSTATSQKRWFVVNFGCLLNEAIVSGS